MTFLKCRTLLQTSRAQAELRIVSIFLRLAATDLFFRSDLNDDEADKASKKEENTTEDEAASPVENVQRSCVHVHSKILPVSC